MNQLAPNLFLLGAAKCGTSSLHYILGQHPDIHACCGKEPTFFNWPFQVVRNPLEYFRLFDSPKRYRLDSSGAYLSNRETAPVLRSVFPSARFIISVRDPKARAYSLYREMRRLGHERLPTFVDALRAEAGRSISREFVATSVVEFWDYMYCRSSQYDKLIGWYFELFDPAQFHILSLAELAKDPLAATARLLRFLDLDEAPAQLFDYSAKYRNSPWQPYDGESDQIMSVAFEGLTERTDRLVGRGLDWSM